MDRQKIGVTVTLFNKDTRWKIEETVNYFKHSLWSMQLKEVRPPKLVLNLMYIIALSKRAWVKKRVFTIYRKEKTI